MLKKGLILILNVFIVSQQNLAETLCHEGSSGICPCLLEDLHPMQFRVGLEEVLVRKTLLYKKVDKIAEYTKNKPITVILGPAFEKGKFLYIVDGHHGARMLLDLGVKKAYCKVIGNYSQLNQENFWKTVSNPSLHFTWLTDEGISRMPNDLPNSLRDLLDDPYRTLAGLVERKGDFKSSYYFSEFIWVDYFRNHIPAWQLEKFPEKTIEKASQLAHSQKAALLPGFLEK